MDNSGPALVNQGDVPRLLKMSILAVTILLYAILVHPSSSLPKQNEATSWFREWHFRVLPCKAEYYPSMEYQFPASSVLTVQGKLENDSDTHQKSMSATHMLVTDEEFRLPDPTFEQTSSNYFSGYVGETITGNDNAEQKIEEGFLATETPIKLPLSNAVQQLDLVLRNPVNMPKLKASITATVRVYVVRKVVDFGDPWLLKGYARASGSGFSFEGDKIITNAHVVTYAASISVQRPGISALFEAEVFSVAHELDLAILIVKSKIFWKELPSLELAERLYEIPELFDDVIVIGYPTGGESISITKGVISRIQVGTYAHSKTRLLEIQIDAAINHGNSGGPVINSQGKLVGVAFQGLTESNSIGYIIPVPVVRHFLEDIKKHGKYTGLPSFGVELQHTRNKSLLRYFNLTDPSSAGLDHAHVKDRSGCIVTDVAEKFHGRKPGLDCMDKDCTATTAEIGENSNITACNAELRRGDVLLSIMGEDISEDCSFRLRGQERVGVEHLITGKYTGEFVSAVILRNNTIIDVNVPLEPSRYVVPRHTKDNIPRYYIIAGIIFVPLTKDYVSDRKVGLNRAHLAVAADIFANKFQSKVQQELVVLSRILPSEVTSGYNLQNEIVDSVNGISISSLSHLKRTITALLTQGDDVELEEYLSFRFKTTNQFLIIGKKLAQYSHTDILKENGILMGETDSL